MSETIRVALNEPNFRDLVAGKVVTLHCPGSGAEVSLILSDIGWGRMVDALVDALDASASQMSREEIVGILKAQFGREFRGSADG